MENSGGDKLASGAVKFQFRPAGSHMSKEAWDRMWENDDESTEIGRSTSNATPARNAGSDIGATEPNPRG